MKTRTLSLVLLLPITAVLAAPPSADDVIAEAKAKATAEKKAIYVHFGASWCGWCKRLDAFLERPDIKPVFEKYFVLVKLVVQENEKNKALERVKSCQTFFSGLSPAKLGPNHQSYWPFRGSNFRSNQR